MFHIRKITDASSKLNKEAIRTVKKIMLSRFYKAPITDIEALEEKLTNPFKYKFISILLVAEKKEKLEGFALILHEPKLNFIYLDYLASSLQSKTGGIGGALYERARIEAIQLKCKAMFFECLPDDEKLSPDIEIREENIARLKFYERFGVTPVINTKYETPIREDDDNPPYLMIDNLGRKEKPTRRYMKRVVRTVLENKYGNYCSKKYTDTVVKSFKDDPVKVRDFLYTKKYKTQVSPLVQHTKIPIIINDKHDIHHIPEKGYVESPVRIKTIVKEIFKLDIFKEVKPSNFSESYIREVHDKDFVSYLKNACKNVPTNKSIYPYIFPVRNTSKMPKSLPIRAGYYCIDTFTPLNQNAFIASKRAVDCTLTAVNKIIGGYPIAYSLVRPPGHHAEKRAFGGFCYFNNTAVGANQLSKYGKVAVLDIDFHHGNGTQDIFYKRNDVLTVSIHGNPVNEYPYFSGFANEKGEGEGLHYNINYPLDENSSAFDYFETLKKAIKKIKAFKPEYLVIAIGFDTASGDPTGSFRNTPDDFYKIGEVIGNIKLPTLIVQEGGYYNRMLGKNAYMFFKGLYEAYFE